MVKISKTLTSGVFRTKPILLNVGANGNQFGSFRSDKKRLGVARQWRRSETIPTILDTQELPYQSVKSKAKVALEVCKAVGLQFEANDFEVCKRLAEIEIEAGDL
ncbi:hypothetical protein V6N11_037782 [Hibiscus sabdariffa]|uniref:Uncharacterized protein n=1 Tax=Hibiscus sabdariffa TaxID=183260 RepID=A0ABR2PEH1_9ROSI